MDFSDTRTLLQNVAQGSVDIDEALGMLRSSAVRELTDDIPYASLDIHRGIRQGVSEVVYGEGKTAGQIAHICAALVEEHEDRVLITRLDETKAQEVQSLLTDLVPDGHPFAYHALPRLGILGTRPEISGAGDIVVA